MATAVVLLWAGAHCRLAAATITLQGSTGTYYPVFFQDGAWGDGIFELSIYRANVHTDALYAGSLEAVIRSHSSQWGHGSDFLEHEIHWSSHQLIAGIARPYYSSGVVVWLQGGRTYSYSSNHSVTVSENSANGSELVLYDNPTYGAHEAYVNRSSVDDSLIGTGHTFDGDTSLQGNLGVKGNVGIGTSNPTHKLAVNGAVRAKEVIVDTGWSDYVFADDYRLAPLSEVERHIKTERHLPGIPSAAEVAKEGVSVGEMQAKLLAKIEELTLHQIQLEKEIMALKGAQAQREAKSTP